MDSANARTLARYLPGDIRDNVEEVLRLRGQRVRKLQAAGLSRREIEEATGWTERQQRYALRRANHAP